MGRHTATSVKAPTSARPAPSATRLHQTAAAYTSAPPQCADVKQMLCARISSSYAEHPEMHILQRSASACVSTLVCIPSVNCKVYWPFVKRATSHYTGDVDVCSIQCSKDQYLSKGSMPVAKPRVCRRILTAFFSTRSQLLVPGVTTHNAHILSFVTILLCNYKLGVLIHLPEQALR